MATSILTFFVNGKEILEAAPSPSMTLAEYLRSKLGLTGTKVACGEGGCGACTVMLSRYDVEQKKPVHFSANACLIPVCAVHGMAVVTVEGIGNAKRLHPVQERLARAHGSQCGYCTPGIVMSMYALLRNFPSPTEQQVEDAFDGNLCRCTGYRPILTAFRSFATAPTSASKEATNPACPCGRTTGCCSSFPPASEQVKRTLFDTAGLQPLDPSQDIIFPPKLILQQTMQPFSSLIVTSGQFTWIAARDLDDLIRLKAQHPSCRIVVGNTEIGIDARLKQIDYHVLIYAANIASLTTIQSYDNHVTIGSSVTLANIQQFIHHQFKVLPSEKVRPLKALFDALEYFAGNQIRNVASIVGNIVTASPISDINPVLIALNAHVNVNSLSRGNRRISLRQFFVSYRKTVLEDDDVIVSIEVPLGQPTQFVQYFKQARRKDDDIAIVNACFLIEVDKISTDAVVTNASFVYGGVGPVTVQAIHSSSYLQGRHIHTDVIPGLLASLSSEVTLDVTAPGGMIEYRLSLVSSFAFKFMLSVINSVGGVVDDRQLSATQPMHRPISISHQVFEAPLVNKKDGVDTVGTPVLHASGVEHATGEAQYVDDIPRFFNELSGVFVPSTMAHARIINIDYSAALAVPGVHSVVTAKDVPGVNSFGVVVRDDQVFAENEVKCIGYPVAMVLADTRRIAQQAARLVKVEYEKLPEIITIEDAIQAKSYYVERTQQRGDVTAALATAQHVLQGEMRVGGQEHFYLETNVCLCVPKREHGEMEVFSSTQAPTDTQTQVAAVLGLPRNRIIARTKRIGGAFGGKEARSVIFAVAAAVCAHVSGRPVRVVVDRDEDMLMSGGRHPFLAKYQVGFTSEGRITAYDLELYNNGGCSLDLSGAVIEKSMFASDASYFIENMRVTGRSCRTNLPSNTGFRAFGTPQSMIVAESVISDVARACKLPQHVVRLRNFLKEGDRTLFNQQMVNCNLKRVFDEMLSISKYESRLVDVENYNKQNQYKKRGIAVVPTKFGISFEFKQLNQAGALVHIYTDGSVLISHGGVEMGQGLHTKGIQITARALGVPVDKIYLSETSTSVIPNASPTAGSYSSDLYGAALLDACDQLNSRLQKYKEANPNHSFTQWVNSAYIDRISLSANGFYMTHDFGDSYNWESNSGSLYRYFVYGASCSEVELDTQTGDYRVVQSDVVMDIGASLNPGIDFGQIEGGFVQGMGLFTMEEKLFSPNGNLITRGPSTYKIPAFKDIPEIFNVSLLRNMPNPKAIFSSKAVGEPPLFLAASVFFAIKDAVAAARRERGCDDNDVFRMDSPATVERITLAAQNIAPLDDGGKKRWNVTV